MQHKYKLEKYKGMNTRHTCPSCRQKGKFTYYIDIETNAMIANNVGRCERIDQCGYHFTPKQFFNTNGKPENKMPYIAPIKVKPNPATSFIDTDIFKASLKGYNQNNFYKYLATKFGAGKANTAAMKYYLGTSKKFKGACVFWQVDLNGLVRTGKIMGYSELSGKRVKEPFDQITWAHCALKLTDFELNQCLFGLHLTIDKTKAVAIVESEKTAMIASIYLPDFIWLAAGGKKQLTKAKCMSLKGHKVVLYPDLGGFKEWDKTAKEYGFSCSDLLECKATAADRENGLDLADYLTRQPLQSILPPK